jgi:hypothetical protein
MQGKRQFVSPSKCTTWQFTESRSHREFANFAKNYFEFFGGSSFDYMFLKRYLLMFMDLIFDSGVDGGMPSLAKRLRAKAQCSLYLPP